MRQKVIGDLVDLALHLLEARRELGEGGGATQELFPPRPLAPHVKLRNREAANSGDDPAQAIARRPHILVAHALQHGLGDFLQFGLRGRTERHDGLRIAHVDLGHAAGDLGTLRRIGLLERHDGVGRGGLGQHSAAHGLDILEHGFGLLAGGL